MFSIIFSMAMFAFIGAISPGPVNIIATSTGANFGFRRALPFALGATVAYALVVFLTGIGLGAVIKTYPQITQTMQYLAAIFLLYMSFKIASAKPTQNAKVNLPKPPSFIEGALAQGINPKAWLVSMSGVSLFVTSNSPTSLYLAIFCGLSFVICFIGVGTWAALGHWISQFLADPKYQRVFNIVMGLLLSATVVFIVLAKL